MNTDGIYSSLLRTAVLMAATAALTLGTAHGSRPLILAGLVLLAATAYAYLRLHRLMHRRSRLMLEAIRNRDYSFRLPAGGATGSERILQDTLNEFGRLMAAQKLLMEQREQFYAHILHTIPMGIVVLDAQQHIVQSNPAAARLLGAGPVRVFFDITLPAIAPGILACLSTLTLLRFQHTLNKGLRLFIHVDQSAPFFLLF